MGIRQMAQPLGVGVTGLTVPVLAQHFGATAGFAVFVVVAVIALAATALTIVDPPHSTSAAGTDALNPYRRTNFLVRVHAVSVLLVVPQVALWTFVPAWLMIARHWPPLQAGVAVTATQVVAALGRIAAGRWSDRWGSRMRPIRIIAALAALLMAAWRPPTPSVRRSRSWSWSPHRSWWSPTTVWRSPPSPSTRARRGAAAAWPSEHQPVHTQRRRGPLDRADHRGPRIRVGLCPVRGASAARARAGSPRPVVSRRYFVNPASTDAGLTIPRWIQPLTVMPRSAVELFSKVV